MAEPSWALLPPDVWRLILCRARGVLPHLQPGPQKQDSVWVSWWRLLARVSGTCSTLREALLGCSAQSLWASAYFESPRSMASSQGSALGFQYPAGLHRLQLSQAHHACSAMVRGTDWRRADLQQVLSSPTSVRSLTLFEVWSPRKAACCFCSLPPQLTSFGYQGRLPTQALTVSMTSMQLVKLSLHEVTDASLRLLADWLPPLARLELSLEFGMVDGPVCGLGLLSLLDVSQLCLRLQAVFLGEALRCLRQLQGVQLYDLEVQCPAFLAPSDQVLLARCHVSHQLTLCCHNPAWRCTHLPAGVAEVVYKALGDSDWSYAV